MIIPHITTDKMAVYSCSLRMFCKLPRTASIERTSHSAARSLLSKSALSLAKQSGEETSDGLDGQDASRPLFVDGEAVPGGKQAPTQGRPRRSAPDLSAVREGDLSDRLHQQDDRARSTVSWSALVDRAHRAVVYPCAYVCVYV